MIHSVRFTAVLDTNVIYPVIIRDFLLWFALFANHTSLMVKALHIKSYLVFTRLVAM